MIWSRRGFLQSLAVSALGGVAAQSSLKGMVSEASCEPTRSGQDGSLIRLDSNENAYGPSTKVAAAIESYTGSVNRYSRSAYPALRERIATFHKLNPHQILLGCGSTDILRMAACAFLGPSKQLIQASPTFGALEHYARAVGSDVLSVPLTQAYAHDLDVMLLHASASASLIYICNPNNPTASLTPRTDLETFIGKLPASTIVLIDEAYHDYVGQSGMYRSFIDRSLIDDRVIVTRTFSKVYGLAGLRLGYAVASPRVVQRLHSYATENNVNSLVTHAAMAALDDNGGVDQFVRRNSDERQEFFNQAMARALKPIDSHTNFVMMNTYHPANQVSEHFRQSGVLISRPFPAMDTYIRVSLGRQEEMIAFWRTWDILPFAKNIMHH